MSTDPRDPQGESISEDEAQKSFMKEFQQAISSYSGALELGNPEAAEAAAMQAMLLAAEEAARHPTPSLLLTNEAAECESKRDWAGAEAAYRKVLPLEEATGNHCLIAKAEMDLSKLLRLVGRLEEAGRVAALATASARRADMFPVLVMTLENEVSCALARKEPQAALIAATEMVQVIEPGKLHDSMRARALIDHARCLVATGDWSGAESKLAASWDLLHEPSTCLSLPGPTFALALWWDVKSQVLEHKGELEEAREAMAQSIGYRRQNDSPYAAFGLVSALEKYAELLRRSGELAEAERAIAESGSLREDLRLPVP